MQSSYRSGIRALKKLASCDMHLNLPGARQSEYFDEEWISTSSALATRELGRVGGSTQRRSASLVMESVAKDAGIRSLHTWTNEEKQGFSALAPIVAAVAPGAWSTEAKRSLRGVLRAKGGKRELDYAKRLCRDVQFLSSLQKACRTQE